MNVLGMEFEFAHPWVLGLAPLLWLAARRPTRTGAVRAIVVASIEPWRAIGRPTRARRRATDWPRWGLFALLLFALARPRLDGVAQPDRSEGIDIMLLVDASRSMDTEDFDAAGGERISRLAALRRVLGEFIAARPNDRLGVIAFAERPYLVSPLTLDHAWLMEALAGLETALGTAIGSSIEAGVDLLRGGNARSRALLLVTDGINTSGADVLAAARRAVAQGIRIHVIETVSYDEMRPAELEAHPLAAVARLTGGQFFQAPNALALGGVYRAIDRLEKAQLEQLRTREQRELFPWLLVGTLGLLAAEMVWRATRGAILP